VIATVPMSGALALPLMVVAPLGIWALTDRAGARARRRYDLATTGIDWREWAQRSLSEQAYLVVLAVFICMAGIWAATIVIPVAAVCLSGGRPKSGSDDHAPPDGATLTPERAREIAHMRLGHRRVSALPAVRMTIVVAGSWLVAVGMGALSFTYRVPLSGFAPDWSAVPAAAFGLALWLALTSPMLLQRARQRERAADDVAVHLLGDGPGYARWIADEALRTGNPLWPPRLFTALAWSYPPTGQRIERALTYGSRPATPSFTPAGAGRHDWFGQHRQAALLGAWTWILVIGWVLGKLHAGGVIR